MEVLSILLVIFILILDLLVYINTDIKILNLNITKNKIIFIVISIIIIFIYFYTINIVKNNTNNVDMEDDSVRIVNEAYVPPDSLLPKDCNEISKLLSKFISNYDVTFNLSYNKDFDICTINYNNKVFYLKYDKTYDCTLLYNEDGLNSDIPTKIFYHYEYDSEESFSDDIFNFIINNDKESNYSVNMYKDDSGKYVLEVN